MQRRAGRPWRRLKARIIRRDGGICHLCGQPGADSADHLIPFSHGGTDQPSNLAAAHQRCNRIRQAKPVDTARRELTASEDRSGWDW